MPTDFCSQVYIDLQVPVCLPPRNDDPQRDNPNDRDGSPRRQQETKGEISSVIVVWSVLKGVAANSNKNYNDQNLWDHFVSKRKAKNERQGNPQDQVQMAAAKYLGQQEPPPKNKFCPRTLTGPSVLVKHRCDFAIAFFLCGFILISNQCTLTFPALSINTDIFMRTLPFRHH